jgi:ethanolamine utilization protein EutA
MPSHAHDEHAHDHDHDADDRDWMWDLDNVELTTAGVDIGSSTSHLMFSRVQLQRRSHDLSSRFVIVDREVLWRSPVLLTPYLPDNTIDADAIHAFLADAYRCAGLAPDDIDTGAVILTGEALKRHNARTLAEAVAAGGGNFVCASAGHHLEAVFAAHGSGTVTRSRRTGSCVLNIDVGGGTCKLALIDRGHIVGTAALEVGGRLLAYDEHRVLIRVEEPIRRTAGWVGLELELELGQVLAVADEERLVGLQVAALIAAVEGRWDDDHAADLLVTDPLHLAGRVLDAITFTGGVAEYIYGREQTMFGDLAITLAHGLRAAFIDRGGHPPVEEPEAGIRATVVGSSQFSAQLSGNTIDVDDRGLLPVHNVPVIDPGLDLSGVIDADQVAAGIEFAVSRAVAEATGPLALALRWAGDPEFSRLHALAEGVSRGMAPFLPEGCPLVVVVDHDIGKTLGRLIREEGHVAGRVLSLDGLILGGLDYIDLGEMIQPAGVVPVVVKSLLFAPTDEVAGGHENSSAHRS